MRIFHILKYTSHGAGNVCAVIDLACEQARLGHKVYVCSSVGSFGDLLAKHDVEYININQVPKLTVLVPALFRLHRALRARKPDIVHAHMIFSALLTAVLRPIMKYKLVTTVHNEFQPSAILMAVGQRVIGVSEAVSRSMIRRGISPSKMRTVLNGTINSARRPEPTPAPLELQRPAIVSVCGMHPRKGIPDLINAFAMVVKEHPTAHLYFAGIGPMEDEYRALGKKVNASAIHFCGYLDDPRPLLLGADVFVLASHAEPAGLVISEAREAGCAIVASNVGGIPEMTGHGKAGILVPPEQPAELARAISKLLGDPKYLAEMRQKSQLDLNHFTMERVATEVAKVYSELLSK